MQPPEIPFRTAVELWASRVARSGDGLAFRHKKDGAWHDLTWREADRICREIAGGLVSLGLAPGDRVGLLCQTRLEWMLADIAILMAGGVTVPIYPSSTADQTAYIMKDAGARIAVVEDAAQLEKVLPLLTGGEVRAVHVDGDTTLDKPDTRGRTVVALGDVKAAAPPGASGAIVGLEALRAGGRALLEQKPDELERRTRGLGPDSLFTIIYTSGTTGQPKGVVLSHLNLVAGVSSACRALTINAEDLQYLWLTLAHVLGRVLGWAPILMGAPTAFTEGLTKIKDNLVEIRPTFMAGVPRIYEKFYTAVKAGMGQATGVKKVLVEWALRVGEAYRRAQREGRSPGAGLSLQHKLADKLVFSKLRAKLGLDRCRFLVSGGAPLSPDIAEFFHTTGLLVLEGFGLTETMAASHVNRIEKYRFGTVGPALDVIDCKIAEDGEILMRGPSVFKAYYNDPAGTAEAIDAEGWFHTGDIGQVEDGFLRITDRKKDLIVTAVGKKVAPQMVENALKARCPLVSQVMVYGDKRPYCVALVTLAEETVKKYGDGDGARAAADAELQVEIGKQVEALNATLAPYEQIKRFAILPADFTEATGDLTPSLKVKRKVVVERNRALLDGLYGKSAEAA